MGRCTSSATRTAGSWRTTWRCKGLPGLRAVASLAGTSYVNDSSCAGAAPVSVLHIHGTADEVLRFEGDESARFLTPSGDAAFYVGARDIVTRWSERAGCAWPEDTEPYAALDFDSYVPGAETRAYRQDAGCAEGVTIELWEGEGRGTCRATATRSSTRSWSGCWRGGRVFAHCTDP